VDERAGAFEQARGAAGDCVHGGDDEHFSGDVVDEETHPGAEGFEGRHGGGEALFGCGELFDFAAVDGFDEGVASWEVAIEGAGAKAGSAYDVVEARSGAVACKGLLGYFEDALAVAEGVGARLADGRGWRKLLLWHRNRGRKYSATGECPRLSYYVGTVSVLFDGDADVNWRALPGWRHNNRR
jgi:hypothetical protein